VLLGRDAEGKNRYDLKDLKGNSFIKELIDVGKAGGGFSDVCRSSCP